MSTREFSKKAHEYKRILTLPGLKSTGVNTLLCEIPLIFLLKGLKIIGNRMD